MSSSSSSQRRGRLSADQIKEFRRVFDLFDSDGSGTITKAELVQAMLNLNLNPDEDAVKAIDSDDGSLCFEEFLDLMSLKMVAFQRDEEISSTFRLFDTDRNGLISSDELRFAMSRLGYKISDREARKMVKELDSDGDGFIGYEEFSQKVRRIERGEEKRAEGKKEKKFKRRE